MAHPEWILTGALFDPILQNRQKAVRHILQDRERRSMYGHEKRKFKKPNVNFAAKTYLELCNFSTCDAEYITEPPITFDFTDDELKRCAAGHDLVLPDIPIHSLNNERAVQETTKACKAYPTYEQRHSSILQTLKSRAELPTEATKRQFK